MTAKQSFRKKILYSSIFCLWLIIVCISHVLYAGGGIVTFKILAMGIHYQGQPDNIWEVREVVDGPTFTATEGAIQPPMEMGVAGELNAGIVDKLALKWIYIEGSESFRGWDRGDDNPADQEMPPDDAYNFLALPGGPTITLEDNSNKKFILQIASDGPNAVVITDM